MLCTCVLITDDGQVNHSDHSDDDTVKGSSFSFVRSDSMPSKEEESSGDENQTQFAFIKEENVKDDVDGGDVPSKSQHHESIKPEAENVSSLSVLHVESVDFVCPFLCVFTL